MGNELEHIHNTYDADTGTKVISWDKNLIDKLASICKVLVPFEHPDAYAIIDDEVLIFEHFEFDSSAFKNKKGTQQRRSEADDDRAFEAVVPIEEGAFHRREIIADYTIKNYRKNLERNFSEHYNEIPGYKKTLREKGIITDDCKITTLFFIEDKTELGNIYESEKEGVPWEPLVLPLCDFFLDIFENSPDLDIVICASWYPDQHCLWCIDRTMISKCRRYAVDTDNHEIINWNPQSEGIKMIIPKMMLPSNPDRFGEKVCCNPTVKLQKGESFPLIDIDKITPGYKTVRSVETIKYTGQGGAKFQDHDVLFARITPCLENGKVAIADTDGQNGIGSTELFVFRGIKDVSDTDYIYYLLRMKHFRQLAANSMTGASGRQRADLDFIKRIKWNFPKFEKQKRIASILTAYDNLIEVNNKRIKVLEQMAENLYKEWFVRFRFPGHETAELVDSKIGRIPSSFAIVKMQDILEFYIGGGWGNDDEDNDYSIPAYVIRGTDFPRVTKGDLSSCPLRYHKKSNYSTRQLEPDDIILEVSGGTAEQPVGRTLLVTADTIERLGGKVICASFCKQMRVKKELISPVFFYYWMQFLYDTRIIDRFQLQSTGIINFQFEYFLRKGDVMLPNKEIMDEFEWKVRAIYNEISFISRQTENLIKQRDLLLPRLMSGKLEV